MTDNLVTTTTPTSLPRRWRILGFLGIAQLMLILDVTVVAIALPHIGGDLNLGRESLTWVISTYTLAFGGLMLLGGRIADLIGARRVVLIALLLFAAASLITGLAGSAPMLIGGRIGQGVAAALLSPAALSLVVTLLDGDDRNKALGIWSALGGGGAALGVLLGGVLTAGPGWPWVFFINVPVAAGTMIALIVLLPRGVVSASGARLDVLGALLVTAATGALIYAMIGAGEHGWLSPATGWTLLIAAVGYVLFVARQRFAREPLMDLRLLVRRPVATGALLIVMATALMIAVFFFGTFYFQHSLGLGALQTGLLFLPVAVTTMLGANVTGRVIGRFGARRLGVIGLVVAAVGMAIPAGSLQLGTALIGVVIAAAGTGVVFVVASATALGQVEPHEAGVASGIVSTFHEFGASIGAAVMSSVAAASIVGATLTGFSQAFGVAAVAAVVSVVLVVVLTTSPRARTR